MASHFFAYMARMKFILRWGLMRNTRPENIAEHSLQVAMVAHALALIRNRRYGGAVDPERVLALSVYHEASEVITGDLATPIKYFNPEIKEAYKRIEGVACDRILRMLPDDLRHDYAPLILQEEGEEHRIVKAADRICALLKCIEEEKAGNTEFIRARQSIERTISALGLPEVADFMAEFVPSFDLTLDELN
ncbi:MAG: 5'-deoxynucleotidase [Clostridiales bacterium]|nr:5'-deoxynucleotidase [Clostridiales bacterium]